MISQPETQATTIAAGYEGVYLPLEVSGYLLATMPAERRPPTSQRIFRWIRRGLVAPHQRQAPGRRITLSFADLVTCQAITFFREAGLSLEAIRRAEQFFVGLYGIKKPFAHRQFWYSPNDLFGRLRDHVISGTRGGQIGWDFLAEGLRTWPNELRFAESDLRAIAWRPDPRISLEPDVQFGQPCLAGTRIPTSALWSYAAAGDSYEAIARAYQIEVKDVEQAVNWESRVRAALDAQKPIPT